MPTLFPLHQHIPQAGTRAVQGYFHSSRSGGSLCLAPPKVLRHASIPQTGSQTHRDVPKVLDRGARAGGGRTGGKVLTAERCSGQEGKRKQSRNSGGLGSSWRSTSCQCANLRIRADRWGRVHLQTR
eukprot:12057733-Alexandrium_andersonii.AAC.1